MEDLEDTLEDEEVDEEGADRHHPRRGRPCDASPGCDPEAGEEDVESIQDILVKQEARAEEAEEEEESVLTLTREERLEPLAVKVVPAPADRVHLLQLLPGQAPEPAEGQGEDALPGLRLSPSRLRLPYALLIAATAGALLSVSLPPARIWPLVFVAPIPLLWLVRGSGPGRAAACGFAFGITYFGALLYWILLFGELGWAAWC